MLRMAMMVLGFYLAVSVVTFIVYVIDKQAAQKNAWRIQESTMHLLSLAGGWPGALLAQKMVRHKSKKTAFQNVFKLSVILNCGLLGWFILRSIQN